MVLVCRSRGGLVVLEAITVAFEADDVGVVNDPVDHRGGDGEVAEDVAPAGEWQVAGHDQGRVFVAGRDELEEQVCGVLVERDVAHFVNDQQAVAAQPDKFGGKFPARVCFLEAGHPAGRGVEEHPVAGLGCFDADADADSEVGFAGAGWPEQDYVLGLGQEHAGTQVCDQVPLGGWLVVEVEVLGNAEASVEASTAWRLSA